jgi:hypothetical protein
LLVDSLAHADADVLLDGVFVGKAPVRQPVAPGDHRVTIFEIALKRRSITDVTIEPGKRRHVGF